MDVFSARYFFQMQMVNLWPFSDALPWLDASIVVGIRLIAPLRAISHALVPLGTFARHLSLNYFARWAGTSYFWPFFDALPWLDASIVVGIRLIAPLRAISYALVPLGTFARRLSLNYFARWAGTSHFWPFSDALPGWTPASWLDSG